MVVMSRSSTAAAGRTHERTGWPSTSTVHAPHCAMPQPYLVPVRPSTSRSTQRSGMSSGTETSWASPFTESFMAVPPERSLSLAAPTVLRRARGEGERRERRRMAIELGGGGAQRVLGTPAVDVLVCPLGEREQVEGGHTVAGWIGAVLQRLRLEQQVLVRRAQEVAAARIAQPALHLVGEPEGLAQPALGPCRAVESEQPAEQPGVVVEEGRHPRRAGAPGVEQGAVGRPEAREDEAGRPLGGAEVPRLAERLAGARERGDRHAVPVGEGVVVAARRPGRVARREPGGVSPYTSVR